MNYSIIRHFQNEDNEVIESGLSLKEAQAHCKDPETSSSTCSDDTLLIERGPWFDGYKED